MALNARIGADFTEFDTSLARMESKVKHVADALGLAFSAAAVIGGLKALTSELLRTADELVRVSDRTGETIEGIQRLGFVASQSGNNLDEITAAIGAMQDRLGSGDKSAASAISRLGLSFGTLAQARPEDAIKMIGTALQGVSDANERAMIATDLFGKTGRAVLPTLLANYNQLAAAAGVMSDGTVRKLDDIGDAWERLKKRITAEAGTAVVAMASAVEQPLSFLTAWMQSGNVGIATVTTAAAVAAKDFVARTKPGVDTVLSSAVAPGKAFSGVVKAAKTDLDILNEVLKQSSLSLHDWNEELWKAAGEGEKAFIKGLDEILALSDELLKDLPSTQAASASLWDQVGKDIDQLAGKVSKVKIATTEGATDWKKWGGVAVSALNETSRAAEMAGNKTMAAMMSIGSAVAQGAMQGGLWGAVSSGALAGLGMLGNVLFKTEGKKVNDLRDAFISAAGGLSALNAKAHDAGMTLDALLKASNVKDYEAAVAALNARFATQVDLTAKLATTQQALDAARASSMPTWDALSGIADKYSISIEKAGRGVQQLMINANATTLLNDWQTWAKAGGDLDVFAKASAQSFSALVSQARTFGTTLPENMKPVLQSLVDQGKLLDASGKVIGDLSGLTFGAGIQTETEKMAAAIDDLVLTLQDLTTQLAVLSGSPPVVVAATGAGAAMSGGFSRASSGGSTVSVGGAGGGGTVVIQLDGRQLAEIVVPEIPGVVQRYGLG
jgi:hypothetical protein